ARKGPRIPQDQLVGRDPAGRRAGRNAPEHQRRRRSAEGHLRSEPQAGVRRQAMKSKAIACPEPPAADAGVKIFARGGTALEAAVASAFAQGVALPLGCGIGGMAHILVARRAWAEPRFLNASVSVGSLAHPEVFEEAFLGRSERAGRYLIRGDQNQLG